MERKLKIVEILVKSGANVDHQDDNGWTPLTIAILKGNLEITTLLSRNGANLNFLYTRNYTPMTYAIHLEKIETIKRLIDCGADVNFNVNWMDYINTSNHKRRFRNCFINVRKRC